MQVRTYSPGAPRASSPAVRGDASVNCLLAGPHMEFPEKLRTWRTDQTDFPRVGRSAALLEDDFPRVPASPLHEQEILQAVPLSRFRYFAARLTCIDGYLSRAVQDLHRYGGRADDWLLIPGDRIA